MNRFLGGAAVILLVVVVCAVVRVTGHHVQFFPDGFSGPFMATDLDITARLTQFLFKLFMVSIFWAALNLMPVYPLDGGQITREIFQAFHPREGIRQSLMLSILTAILLAGIAFIHFHDVWMGVLFGYLAYTSFATLQAYGGHGRW